MAKNGMKFEVVRVKDIPPRWTRKGLETPREKLKYWPFLDAALRLKRGRAVKVISMGRKIAVHNQHALFQTVIKRTGFPLRAIRRQNEIYLLRARGGADSR